MTRKLLKGIKQVAESALTAETGYMYFVSQDENSGGGYVQLDGKKYGETVFGLTDTKESQEFVFRKSPAEIKADTLTIDRIYGNTLAWNQLNNYSEYSAGSINNVTHSKNGNTITLTIGSGGATASSTIRCEPIANWYVPGHRYYLSCNTDFTLGASTFRFGPSSFQWFDTNRGVFSSTLEPTSGSFGIRYESGATAGTYHISNMMIIDLDVLYGTALSGLSFPQMQTKFENDFGKIYPYNSGTLISNDVQRVDTIGFNINDEVYEEGFINGSGVDSVDSALTRSKNYIPCFPSTTYYVKGNNIRIVQYDSQKKFIQRDLYITNATFTTANNTHYIRIYDETANITNTCISIFNNEKNGVYERYRKNNLCLDVNNFIVKSPNIWDEEVELGGLDLSTGEPYSASNSIRSKNYISVTGGTSYYVKIPNGGVWVCEYDSTKTYIGVANNGSSFGNASVTLSNSTRYIRFGCTTVYGTTYNNDICINESRWADGKYFSHEDITITGGLKSAGTVKDEIDGNKYIKRVGSIDLGTRTWTKLTHSGGMVYYNSNSISAMKKGDYFGILTTCSKYVDNKWSDILSHNIDKSCFTNGSSNQICITDNSHSTAPSSSDNWLSGVICYYELATPEEYELVTPFIYTMPAGTTESRISPNSYGLSAPMACDITYAWGKTNEIARDVNTVYDRVSNVSQNVGDIKSYWKNIEDGETTVNDVISALNYNAATLKTYIDSNFNKKPVIVYQTDGSTGLLGHNGSSLDNRWQLENLQLSAYTHIRCYFSCGTATGESRTPAVVVEIPLDDAAAGPSGYIGSIMVPMPFNRNREYLVSCAVDTTKTKFQVLHQNTLWDISVSDANNNKRYCYKIEGWY